MKHIFFLAVAVLCAAGISHAQERAAAFFDTAVAQHTCAPWDGAAITVTLTHAGQEYPKWMVSFYRLPAKTGTWLDFSDANEGYATYCKEQNGCVPAQAAKVMLNKMTDNEVSGELQAEMDGATQSFPFGASVLPGNALCG